MYIIPNKLLSQQTPSPNVLSYVDPMSLHVPLMCIPIHGPCMGNLFPMQLRPFCLGRLTVHLTTLVRIHTIHLH